jgi:hypothetical protein
MHAIEIRSQTVSGGVDTERPARRSTHDFRFRLAFAATLPTKLQKGMHVACGPGLVTSQEQGYVLGALAHAAGCL